MKRLIPRDINIYEQFRRRNEFVAMVTRWCRANPNFYKISTIELLKVSGVRCWYMGENLAGFELLDEEAYLMFKLKYSNEYDT